MQLSDRLWQFTSIDTEYKTLLLDPVELKKEIRLLEAALQECAFQCARLRERIGRSKDIHNHEFIATQAQCEQFRSPEYWISLQKDLKK